MKLPFFDYPKIFREHEEEYLAALELTLRKGAFIMQEELARFEDALANFLGCRHVIGVADGTAALEMSLLAAGLKRGDEVIISTHTFIATAAAVHNLGATPVLADCLPDSTIDPESIRRLISPKTKIIMPTQLNGRTCDMDSIQAIAQTNQLQIVEDSCQALGASYKGTKAGLFGVAGSYSFYPAKTLGCFGDGGAIATNSDQAADVIRQLRDHGRRLTDGKVTMFGRNGRLDNIQAAILSVKLKRYRAALERRRAIASIYQQELENISNIILPPAPRGDDIRYDIYQNYEIQAEDRENLRAHLREQGIGTIIQWGGWMVHQFDDLKLRSDINYAEGMSNRYMLLPMHHLLEDEEVHYICKKIKTFYT